jgi:transposase InsO family protein
MISLTDKGGERPQGLSLTRACHLVGLSRAACYYAPVDTAQAQKEAATLLERIEAIVLEFAGYGYRRVTAQLHRDGVVVNRKRVLSVMRDESLLCRNRRRWITTTDSEHGLAVYPNLIKGLAVTAINQVFQSDITYVRLPKGFCYLACVLDAHSRRIVGHAMSLDIDARLAVSALRMALADRKPEPEFIHHSDRGVQYACREYVDTLKEAGARISMSAKGKPRDNAKAESFFKTLKAEEVYLQDYQSFTEAKASLEHFIEAVYNQKRLHSSLGYLPPTEIEQLLSTKNTA